MTDFVAEAVREEVARMMARAASIPPEEQAEYRARCEAYVRTRMFRQAIEPMLSAKVKVLACLPPVRMVADPARGELLPYEPDLSEEERRYFATIDAHIAMEAQRYGVSQP